MRIPSWRRTIAVFTITLTACSSNGGGAATPATGGTDSIATPAASTTTVENTTVATTTIAATTTTAPAPSALRAEPEVLEPATDPLAWQRRTLGLGAIAPCCAEEWRIGVSPPLGAPGQPFADGVYPFSFQRWNPEFGGGAQTSDAIISVQRFDSCARDRERGGDLTLGCEPGSSDAAVEVDRRYAVEFPLAMDADVVVGYTAPGDCGPNGQDPPGAKQYVTTGAGYTEMTTELANDYTAWIGSALVGPSAGVTDEQILERLRTDPASPFEVDTCGGVRWTSSRGIDVLLQSLRGRGSIPRESWELTIPVTMQVSDGRVMLYIGGYYVP